MTDKNTKHNTSEALNFIRKRVLFMHPNFPGQFRYLAPAIVKLGAEVRVLTFSAKRNSTHNIKVDIAQPSRQPFEHVDSYLKDLDVKIIRARASEKILLDYVNEGWLPDIIIGHSGWGDMMFVKSIFPSAKVIGWFEFYYGDSVGDLHFDPEFPTQIEDQLRGNLKNMLPLWMAQQVDGAVCATKYQKSIHPKMMQSMLKVFHEGVNTDYCCPNDSIAICLNEDLKLTRENKVITFINRNLEPYRGYHSFIRSLPRVFEKHPDAHVVIVGGDGVSYGSAPKAGGSWKHVFLQEVADQLDPARVHFLGTVDYATLVALMQLSRAHVYLTYPFVLSWSLLEAMSCGAPILASDTAPVKEVVRHNRNGLLVDFFDYQAIADGIDTLITMPEKKLQKMRRNAREKIVKQYDLDTVCLPNLLKYIEGF